jgi:hypothetical protein
MKTTNCFGGFTIGLSICVLCLSKILLILTLKFVRYILRLPRNLEFSRKFSNLPISPDMFPFLHLAVQYRNLISVSLAHCPAKISD